MCEGPAHHQIFVFIFDRFVDGQSGGGPVDVRDECDLLVGGRRTYEGRSEGVRVRVWGVECAEG